MLIAALRTLRQTSGRGGVGRGGEERGQGGREEGKGEEGIKEDIIGNKAREYNKFD